MNALEEKRLNEGVGDGQKEYQSLFWVPMLYQTAESATMLVENMLDDITEFYESSQDDNTRSSLIMAQTETGEAPVRKRREKILGDDSLGNEVVATRVEVVTKSDDTVFTILSVLKAHFLFSNLHDYELEDVVDSMVDEYFEDGDDIICEGDVGDKYYILEEGSCDIMINGSVVGQTGNLAQFLGKLKLFESLNMESLSQLAKSLTLKTYNDGDYIITQGEIGEHFFVIYKGKVRITKTGDDGVENPLITLSEGSVFGERALIKKEPRAANVIADTSAGTCECYSLAKDDFANMLGGIEILDQLEIQKNDDGEEERLEVNAEYQCKDVLDLQVFKPLGKGSFGNVYLAKHRVTGKTLALKCLDKSIVVKASQAMYVTRECECLHHLSHQFIAAYYGVFVTPRKIMFSMEFVPGQELWSYLNERETKKSALGGLPVYDVTLYLAQIILALEHIHSLGYCYRDLKSENILFDERGYIKVVDFGFAKSVPYFNKGGEVQYRTFTLCGTPEYMAPEVVLTQGHDKSADYWALGCLAFEMIQGLTPFESATQKRVFEKIVHSQRFLVFANSFDPHMKSFVRRLMHPKAALRIGALQNGFMDIKDHAIFNTKGKGTIDFDKLQKYEIEMPYKPKVSDDSAAHEKTEDELQREFDAGLNVGIDLIDLVEEASIEDDINEDLFQDLLDIDNTAPMTLR
eukprot:GSChrysophyteH1.ASY1.ANO1.1951.1 assembled CDS